MAKSTVIITYDLEKGQTEVKAELKRLGYRDTIQGHYIEAPDTAVTVNLPNTTLAVVREGMTPPKAIDEFNDVVFKLNIMRGPEDQIDVERLFACEPENWRAMVGYSDRT